MVSFCGSVVGAGRVFLVFEASEVVLFAVVFYVCDEFFFAFVV